MYFAPKYNKFYIYFTLIIKIQLLILNYKSNIIFSSEYHKHILKNKGNFPLNLLFIPYILKLS